MHHKASAEYIGLDRRRVVQSMWLRKLVLRSYNTHITPYDIAVSIFIFNYANISPIY